MKTFDNEIQRYFEIKEEILKLNKELKSLKKLFKENEIDIEEFKKTILMRQKLNKFLSSNKLDKDELLEMIS